jgi:mRNA-degrading endonuclease RelE of RelBE toxin-antitoxin system
VKVASARRRWRTPNPTETRDEAGHRPARNGRSDRELECCWSARRGQYRLIYSVHDDQMLVRVVRISHRADVHG